MSAGSMYPNLSYFGLKVLPLYKLYKAKCIHYLGTWTLKALRYRDHPEAKATNLTLDLKLRTRDAPFCPTQVWGCRISGLGPRVSGFRAQDFGFRV